MKLAERGLLQFAARPATAAALQIADALLHYQSPHQFSYQLALQSRMEALRARRVTPMQVLQRVCAFVAMMERHPNRWRGNQKAEDFALARYVLRAAPAPRRSKRPPSRTLQLLAEELRAGLYPYAFALLRKLEGEADERRQQVRRSMDFDAER